MRCSKCLEVFSTEHSDLPVNKKIIRIGQITKIIQEKKCGFIKINDENDTIYFKIKDIKNGFAEKNKYAEFEIIEYEDKKRAINIKVIRGGKTNGSICQSK